MAQYLSQVIEINITTNRQMSITGPEMRHFWKNTSLCSLAAPNATQEPSHKEISEKRKLRPVYKISERLGDCFWVQGDYRDMTTECSVFSWTRSFIRTVIVIQVIVGGTWWNVYMDYRLDKKVLHQVQIYWIWELYCDYVRDSLFLGNRRWGIAE